VLLVFVFFSFFFSCDVRFSVFFFFFFVGGESVLFFFVPFFFFVFFCLVFFFWVYCVGLFSFFFLVFFFDYGFLFFFFFLIFFFFLLFLTFSFFPFFFFFFFFPFLFFVFPFFFFLKQRGQAGDSGPLKEPALRSLYRRSHAGETARSHVMDAFRQSNPTCRRLFLTPMAASENFDWEAMRGAPNLCDQPFETGGFMLQ